MRRIAAIVLVLCYATVGSGALERWHNAQHVAEDAMLASVDPGAVPHFPFHNDFNCAFHAQLHLSGMAVGWVPLLICVGLFVAFLSILSPPLAPQLVVWAHPCRGPPR